MNREDIIRMAREAGMTVCRDEWVFGEMLERFATLVAAAERNSWPAVMEAMERQVNILTDALAQAKAEEREACAKVCDETLAQHYMKQTIPERDEALFLAACADCAAAIRARGETK